MNVWVQLQSTVGILYRSVMQPLHDVMIGCCSRALFCDVDTLLVQQPNQTHQQYEVRLETELEMCGNGFEYSQIPIPPIPNPVFIFYLCRLTQIRISIAAHLCKTKIICHCSDHSNKAVQKTTTRHQIEVEHLTVMFF